MFAVNCICGRVLKLFRVVYVFGDPVVYPVTTITPTYLNMFTVKILQEVRISLLS